MKQVLQSPTSLTVVRDVPPPACPPGGVLVRNCFSVISSGTERTRVELAQKSLIGKARERPDLVRQVLNRARQQGVGSTVGAVRHRLDEEVAVGYSSAGRVIEVGKEVSELRPGDAVACAGAGHANHAEIISVPRNLCARVPEDVSLKMAAFSAIAGVALHGIHLAEVGLGERVVVIGCGLVGQIACRLLRSAGATAIAVDIDPGPVEDAVRGGADHGVAVHETTAQRVVELCGGEGADAVLITAASSVNDPLVLGAAVARNRGSIVLVGAVPIELPRPPMYEKELSFRVSRSYGPGRYDPEYEERGLDYPIGYVRWTEQRNMEAVLALQAQGKLTFENLVSEVIPVEEAPRAYEQLAAPRKGAAGGALVLAYGKGRTGTNALEERAKPVALPERSDVPAVRASSSTIRPLARRIADPAVGLIGPGSFASRVVVPALTRAGARLEVVGGGRGPSAEAARRQLGFARVASTEEQVIEDPNVDAVIICTRHGSHARLAARALHAGKHVFCEKPVGLTEAEIDAVSRAARLDHAGILAVGFNRRFSTHLHRAREFLGVGSRILASYRVSAGQLPTDHWIHDLEQGGGRALGEVCHFIDSVAYLAASPVVEVHAYGYGESGSPVQAYDRLVINVTFESGSVGSIVYVADGSPRIPKERLEVFTGTRTAIVHDYARLELLDGRRRSRKQLRARDKGHVAELQAFVNGVRTGDAPVALEEIRNVSLTALGVVESLRRGVALRIHPDRP